MAGQNYVQISRDELEAWLTSLPWQWSRVQGKAGVYHIHMSQQVAVKLLSTIGGNDSAVGYADGSMNLELVASRDGKLLNRKAQDRKHFKRTINWRKTWKEGVEHWAQVYQGAASFYDKIAVIDRETYSAAFVKKIESVNGWQNNTMLVDFRNKLLQGGVLTDNQEKAVEKFVATSQKEPPKKQFTPEQEAFLKRLEALKEQAERRDDTWLSGFLRSVEQNIHAGRPLSERQKEVLKDNLVKYKVG